jgi:hypothetical protein
MFLQLIRKKAFELLIIKTETNKERNCEKCEDSLNASTVSLLQADIFV